MVIFRITIVTFLFSILRKQKYIFIIFYPPNGSGSLFTSGLRSGHVRNNLFSVNRALLVEDRQLRWWLGCSWLVGVSCVGHVRFFSVS